MLGPERPEAVLPDRRRNGARGLLFCYRFARVLKNRDFPPKIPRPIPNLKKKIFYHSHRDFLLPPLVKNLLPFP